MTTPSHHLPGDWIVSVANGTLDEARSVLAATHLTLCPVCREAVEIAEAAASGALAKSEEVELAVDPRTLLDRLDTPLPAPARLPEDPVLPWPVLQFTGPLDKVRWSWLAPNVRGIDLPQPTQGLPLRLIRMTAGTHMPHRHEAPEAGVILAGGWDDESGTYVRGDLSIVDPATMPGHDQRIHDDGDCYALVLNEARAVVEGRVFGALSRWLFKI